ncbi:MAG: hypothetical protein GY765_31525 [bacterium]|nr:hypothetical protein [bacterium]
MKVELENEIDSHAEHLRFLPKEEKNRLNNLSKEYFDDMKKHSLSYFNKIDKFLKAPINAKYVDSYENTVADLREKILIKRNEYHRFDELFSVIYDYTFKSHETALRSNRRLIRIFLHYMYWNCDIGSGSDL